MKFLLWGLIGLAVAMWLLHLKKISMKSDGKKPDRASGADAGTEAMCKCVQCGLYIPVSEAIVSQPNAVFCCEEHRRQHFSG